MFEQTQGVTKSKNKSNNNSFMKVLDDYRIANKSNGQSPFIIKTGFEADDSRKGFSKSHFDNSAAFIASISVTYGDDTFGVKMLPDENGRVKFEKTPQYVPDLQTQTSVTQSGAESALEAMAKYIDKNKGKKYGSFFGLMRNSNSFVKYVLKHTQDPNAQKLGKLHSPFTAERAADKVWTNANANPEISVKDLRIYDSNQNLADWMEENKQFAHIKTLLPKFFNNLGLIIMHHGSRTEYEKTHPSLSDSYESKMYDDNEIQLHAMGDGYTLREVRDDIRKKGKAARDAALPAIKYAYEHGQISISDAAVMLDRNSLNPEEVFNN